MPIQFLGPAEVDVGETGFLPGLAAVDRLPLVDKPLFRERVAASNRYVEAESSG